MIGDDMSLGDGVGPKRRRWANFIGRFCVVEGGWNGIDETKC